MAWAAVAAAILLGGPVAAEDFQWHGRVAAGKTVEIKGVNGAIDATAADGDEVEVTATKRGRRSDPGSVRDRGRGARRAASPSARSTRTWTDGATSAAPATAGT